MNHPTDRLPEYVLDDLPRNEAAEVERHLARCEPCRAELRELRVGVVTLVESLPATGTTDGWGAIATRLERERPDPPPSPPPRSHGGTAPWIAAGVFLLLGAGGLWWGFDSWSAYLRVTTEQRQVASWLARPEVRRLPLASREGRRVGSMLLTSDARALIVLPEQAPPGRAYAAWGHEEDGTSLLWLGRDPVFEVALGGFDRFYLSLEPAEGSPTPTEPLAAADL